MNKLKRGIQLAKKPIAPNSSRRTERIVLTSLWRIKRLLPKKRGIAVRGCLIRAQQFLISAAILPNK
jgi:hypothetical protein